MVPVSHGEPSCDSPGVRYTPASKNLGEYSLLELLIMATATKPGETVRVTINKTVNRAAARKTLERLFMTDKSVSKPMALRSRNFKEQPKRRGGTIWTKRPNKLHPGLNKGDSATIKATPQFMRDLKSVSDFVDVKNG
jgi:hypothetical protein